MTNSVKPWDGTPLTFPGSTSTSDAWKLVGSFRVPDPANPSLSIGTGATSTLIAPRWVISAAHSAPQPGQIYVSATGEERRVTHTWNTNSDVSIGLLEAPLSPPSVGFPKLVEDRAWWTVATQLPGWFLLGGAGGTSPRTNFAWVDGTGQPLPGRGEPRTIANDSGGVQLWQLTSRSTPLLGGLAWSEVGENAPMAPVPGTQFTSGTGLPGHATLADFMRHAFNSAASNAQAQGLPVPEAPRFWSLPELGFDPAWFTPATPRKVTLSPKPFGRAELSWRVPVTGDVPVTHYVIRGLGPERRYAIDDPALHPSSNQDASTRVLKLGPFAPGTTLQVTVSAENDNGESGQTWVPGEDVVTDRTTLAALRASGTVSYVQPAEPTELGPVAVAATRVKRAGPGLAITVDYCVAARWTPSPSVPTPAPWFEVRFDGEPLTPRVDGSLPGVTKDSSSGELTFERCGLPAGSNHSVAVSLAGVNGQTHDANVTLPGGPAVGTVLTPPTPRVTALRRASSNAADYCVEVAWDTPATVAGAAYESSLALIDAAAVEVSSPWKTIAPNVRQICGLTPGSTYHAQLQSAWRVDQPDGVLAAPAPFVSVTTPSGAPNGTPLGAPQSVTLTTEARNNAGKVDYCGEARFTVPAAVDGFPVNNYTVYLYSSDVSVFRTLPVSGSGSQRTVTSCGLPPGKSYVAQVIASYTPNPSETVTRGAGSPWSMLPAGAPLGTPWPTPVATTGAAYRNASGELCLPVRWTAPSAIAGFTVGGYTAWLWAGGGAATAISPTLAGSAQEYVACGLTPGATYTAYVFAAFSPGTAMTAHSVQVTLPA